MFGHKMTFVPWKSILTQLISTNFIPSFLHCVIIVSSSTKCEVHQMFWPWSILVLLPSGEKHISRYNVYVSFSSSCFQSDSLNCSAADPLTLWFLLSALISSTVLAFLSSFHPFIFLSFFLHYQISLFLWGNYISLSVCVGSVTFYVRQTWKWLVKHLGLASCYVSLSPSLSLL